MGSEALHKDRTAAKRTKPAGAGQGKAESAGTGAGAKGASRAACDEEAPPSFSKVDLRQPPADIAAAFPLFPGVDAALEVVLEAGSIPWPSKLTRQTEEVFFPPRFSKPN